MEKINGLKGSMTWLNLALVVQLMVHAGERLKFALGRRSPRRTVIDGLTMVGSGSQNDG